MKIEGADEAGKYERANEKLDQILRETRKVIVGQDDVLEKLLISVLCDGNVLVESYPGLGKTKMIRTLSDVMGLEFSRIQNTPDLMPSDITGTHIIDETRGEKEFVFQKGPIFANMILADEINRATPKTQAALLEAMQEKQVTAGNESYQLDKPFFLMATQNPIDQEGSLHPDETLYMDGKLWKARDALEYAREEGVKIDGDNDTTLYDVGATTRSLNPEGEMEKTGCMVYEKEYDGHLYSFETKTGRKIKVSGNHPFLVNRAGNVSWVKARDLEEDDHLVSPEKLPSRKKSFKSHEETLDRLDDYRNVRKPRVKELEAKLNSGEELDAEELDDLRIACELSKKQLAEKVDSSYDQVLNALNGCENRAIDQIQDVLEEENPVEADYFESFKIHRISREPTGSEAGFLTGFAMAEGSITDGCITVWQKNLTAKLEKWIEIAEDLGLDVSTREKESGTEAKIRSKPFVDYLRERYVVENMDRALTAPEDYKSAFLEIFLLTESHFDRENKRITFTQKDRETVNVIAHLLLESGIVPWIYDEDRVYRLKIQGEDIRTYLERFEWPGREPEVDSFDSAHRTVPLDQEKLQKVVELLGVRNEGEMSDREWYNSYSYLQTRRDRMARKHFRKFLEDMEKTLERRKNSEIDPGRGNTQEIAKKSGLAITDVVENTSVTRHGVWKTYQEKKNTEEVTEYVSQEYDRRINRAEEMLSNLKELEENDVFYDRVTSIQKQEYSGKVIGLAVPGNHNYIAGLGACGINHNTYPLPEAQSDRFLMKIKVDYPSEEEETKIVDRFTSELNYDPELEEVLSKASVIKLQEFTSQVPIADDILARAVKIVKRTRQHDDLDYGASPRASLSIVKAAKARALVEGRNHVSGEDIEEMAVPVMRHRVGLNFQAEKKGRTPEDVIEEIVEDT